MSSTSSGPGHDELDPVFLHARREALWILGAWAACLLWAVPYCYLNGYNRSAEELQTILGMPDWVFWGIVVPWILADVFAIWFCFFYMVDDDLGEAQEGRDLEEEIAQMHSGEQERADG